MIIISISILSFHSAIIHFALLPLFAIKIKVEKYINPILIFENQTTE